MNPTRTVILMNSHPCLWIAIGCIFQRFLLILQCSFNFKSRLSEIHISARNENCMVKVRLLTTNFILLCLWDLSVESRLLGKNISNFRPVYGILTVFMSAIICVTFLAKNGLLSSRTFLRCIRSNAIPISSKQDLALPSTPEIPFQGQISF